jgi:hypothetical protein
MLTPVAPSGPHDSEQHRLLQPAPVHRVPAGEQAAEPTVEHRPSVAPDALSQLPPQHSKSLAHTSPVCWQNEALLQRLFASHCLEQQSLFSVHGLPSVRQVPPASGTHLLVAPTSQLPLQHSALLVQLSAAGVSALQSVAEHWFEMHELVQHSGPLVHDAPAALHPVPPSSDACDAHSPTAAPGALLQILVQQSVSRPQA